MTDAERDAVRRQFEQWGIMDGDLLKNYRMDYNAERNTYYNGYWDRAWQSWQAAYAWMREQAVDRELKLRKAIKWMQDAPDHLTGCRCGAPSDCPKCQWLRVRPKLLSELGDSHE